MASPSDSPYYRVQHLVPNHTGEANLQPVLMRVLIKSLRENMDDTTFKFRMTMSDIMLDMLHIPLMTISYGGMSEEQAERVKRYSYLDTASWSRETTRLRTAWSYLATPRGSDEVQTKRAVKLLEELADDLEQSAPAPVMQRSQSLQEREAAMMVHLQAEIDKAFP